MTSDQALADRLLVIEDSRSDALVVRYCLMAAAGPAYDVVIVESLGQALSAIEQAPFDLILLDLTLPDSSGLETLSRIIGAAPSVPVVVLTGRDEEGIGLSCIDAGAQDYLCKADMTRDNLGRVVSFALGRNRETQAKLLRMVVQTDRTLASTPNGTEVTRALAGAGSIRERNPDLYAMLQVDYQALLEQYVENLTWKKKPNPKETMEILVTRLGDLGATPRDMIDIHAASLDRIRQGAKKSMVYTYAADSRLFALEMMGLLVEYYRIGTRRLFTRRVQS